MPARNPGNLDEILTSVFRHDGFRPHQEAVCRAALAGYDTLLVMPTGAGKSLCFQLPGLARGGVTLVVSPLVALMEDQVAKLKALGLRAECLHAGRGDESRQVFADYHQEKLDFLFVSPERLAAPGFFDMVKTTPPTFIAVDEAHCISQWGHDFRPEYRMMGERLRELRPTPIMALTATATSEVQDDILRQLGMPGAQRFIHGFRRTNIAIEVVEVPLSERPRLIMELLKDPARRPAIVYGPTRKLVDRYGAELAASFKAASYHAGMTAQQREKVQGAFQSGKVDVVVATVAFGMGIDKSNIRTVLHVALPASMEGYYQEIGRAGRDGLASSAVMLHSFSDRRTHEFLFEKSYPEPALLQAVYQQLAPPKQKKQLMKLTRLSEEELDAVLDKLWVHGGARIVGDEAVRGTEPLEKWLSSYSRQRQHRASQMQQVVSYAEARKCRMELLIRHFGDQDGGGSCGLCDVCRPSGGFARALAASSEVTAVSDLGIRLLQAVKEKRRVAAGTLFRDWFEKLAVGRSEFEGLLSALSRRGMLESEKDSFEKDGRQIEYRLVYLTEAGEDELDEAEKDGRLLRSRQMTARPKTAAKSKKKAASRSKKPSQGASGSAKKPAPAKSAWGKYR